VLLQKLQHVHGYDVLDCHTEEREDLADVSRRADKRETILLDRVAAAAVALNPGLPATVIDGALANAVEEVLHANLPETYDRKLFKTKCDEVFGLMLEYASQGRMWAA